MRANVVVIVLRGGASPVGPGLTGPMGEATARAARARARAHVRRSMVVFTRRK